VKFEPEPRANFVMSANQQTNLLRKFRDGFFTCGLVVVGLFVAYSLRVGLARDYSRVHSKRDVYALPSPRQAIVMSLGYRSAMADLIFANVLVESGLHIQEHRKFDTLAAYLYTVIALDPKFRTPYRLADTLLTFQAGKATLTDFENARKIIEKGLSELPFDQELYLTAGQFFAYLAAPNIAELGSKEEAERWKLAGARALARSCELVGRNENIPYHCITAARLFDAAGERKAMQSFLERFLAVNDDEEVRKLALGYMGRTLGNAEKSEVQRRLGELDEIRKSDLPFVGKNRYLLLPPRSEPFACVGYWGSDALSCATNLRDWHERNDEKLR